MEGKKQPVIVSVRTPFYPIASSYDRRKLYPMENPGLLEAYAAALRREITACAADYGDCEVQAMHIGGGIAGHAFDEALGELLREMHGWFCFAPEAEISLRVHPGMVSAETLMACRRGKVGRLHVDYVTASSFESEAMGRFLPPSVMDTTRMILANAPLLLSFDVLLGLPGQSAGSLIQTLEKARAYGALELVLHPLEVVPGTAFAARAAEYAASTSPRRHLPDASERRILWQEAGRWLEAHGYVRQERSTDISEAMAQSSGDAGELPGEEEATVRYALPGAGSRFHALQAAGMDRIGFGAGAVTRMDGVEAITTEDLSTYIRYASDPERITAQIRPL